MGWGDGKSWRGRWGGPTSLKGDSIVIGLNEKRKKSNKRTDVGLAASWQTSGLSSLKQSYPAEFRGGLIN